MARHVAKSVVQSGLAKKCEIQLGFVLGQTKPVSVRVFTHGTGDEAEIEGIITDSFDLSVEGIIRHLNLTEAVYSKTASYGHFGNNTKDLSWEQMVTIK
jgi:S-adenosylmethionine synthetase